MSTIATAVPTAPRVRRSRRSTYQSRRNTLAAVIFIAPTVVLIVVLRIVPTISAIGTSMHSGLPGSLTPPEFVGGRVFADLFSSSSFWQTVGQTLIFNLIVNPLQIVLALVLAVLLTRGLPAAGLWRTIIFLPAAVPMAGSAIIWGIALRPDGPVNGVLTALGLPAQPFLTSPDQVVGSIILIVSWIGIGYWMMFLIAGLNDIPDVYYEAARIDGAGALRTFFSITLPLLRRPLLFVLVADTVSNFVLFAPVQILTKGGPQSRSNFLMYDIFDHSYNLSNPYTASAELLVLLVIMIVIVAVQFRLLGSGDDE
jgi:ABC-type sugar transport system permease subunit